MPTGSSLRRAPTCAEARAMSNPQGPSSQPTRRFRPRRTRAECLWSCRNESTRALSRSSVCGVQSAERNSSHPFATLRLSIRALARPNVPPSPEGWRHVVAARDASLLDLLGGRRCLATPATRTNQRCVRPTSARSTIETGTLRIARLPRLRSSERLATRAFLEPGADGVSRRRARGVEARSRAESGVFSPSARGRAPAPTFPSFRRSGKRAFLRLLSRGNQDCF
jgi:hypothetical protein